MKMGFFKGIKDSEGQVAKDHNGWWNMLQGWWNDHDSGAKAWTVVNTNSLVAKGTTTNSSVAAGYIGEVIQASIVRSAANANTTGTAGNITSIALTPGIFEIRAMVAVTNNGATSVTSYQFGISTTSAAQSGADTIAVANAAGEIRYVINRAAVVGETDIALPMITSRATVSANTIYYLVVQVNFTVSTSTSYGSIVATRIL